MSVFITLTERPSPTTVTRMPRKLKMKRNGKHENLFRKTRASTFRQVRVRPNPQRVRMYAPGAVR